MFDDFREAEMINHKVKVYFVKIVGNVAKMWDMALN